VLKHPKFEHIRPRLNNQTMEAYQRAMARFYPDIGDKTISWTPEHLWLDGRDWKPYK
jgi:hypothetical protein